MKHIVFYTLCMAFILLTGCHNRVSDYREGLAVYERNGKFGYIDLAGHVIIPAQYDIAKNFRNGMAYVNKNGKWGYIDTLGKIVIPIQYDYIYGYVWDFGKQYAIVESNGKRGYISTTGEIVLPIEYDSIRDGIAPFRADGYDIIRQGNKKGLINSDYKLAIPCTYDDIREFNDNLCAVKIADKWGYIDTHDSLVIPNLYWNVTSFSDKVAFVQTDSLHWRIINDAGTFINHILLEAPQTYSDGMCWVAKNGKYGKYGCLDSLGQLVIPYQYDYVEDLSEGIAMVYKGEGWGVINKKCRLIVPCKYEYQNIEIAENITTTSHQIFDKRGNLVN